MGKILTQEAEEDRSDFIREHGYGGNCSCFISPPCNSCMHPGNPLQQECNDDAWMEEWLGFDEMEQEARNAVQTTIENAASRHLTEMGVGSVAYLYGYNKGWEAQCVASSAGDH